MIHLVQSLFLVIAGATQKELARQVKFLKVENEILRSKLPKRIPLTPQEKHRLVRFAQKLGKPLRCLTSIVTPDTLLRWIAAEKKGRSQPAKPRGRKRTPEEVRKLILKLARETQWGYTRILGELKKLVVCSLSRNTVKRILKEAGYEPAPKRGEGTWDEFLKQHAASLWQCDFFSKRVLTLKGVREVFVLAFLNVKTRQVVLSPATFHPNEAWVVAQAESFVAQLKRLRVRHKTSPFRAPNTNAFVERFIQSIQQECLDRFLIFGAQHMDHICREYLAHFHHERPHQGLDNAPPQQPKKRGRPKTKREPLAEQIVPLHDLRRSSRLGGLLKSYRRAAA